jgi:hypothetical protein
VLLPKEGHEEVADVALQLAKYCIDEPVKSPLIFGGESCPFSPTKTQFAFYLIPWCGCGYATRWHNVKKMAYLATIQHVRLAK